MIEIIRDIIRDRVSFHVENYLQQNKLILGATRDRENPCAIEQALNKKIQMEI